MKYIKYIFLILINNIIGAKKNNQGSLKHINIKNREKLRNTKLLVKKYMFDFIKTYNSNWQEDTFSFFQKKIYNDKYIIYNNLLVSATLNIYNNINDCKKKIRNLKKRQNFKKYLERYQRLEIKKDLILLLNKKLQNNRIDFEKVLSIEDNRLLKEQFDNFYKKFCKQNIEDLNKINISSLENTINIQIEESPLKKNQDYINKNKYSSFNGKFSLLEEENDYSLGLNNYEVDSEILLKDKIEKFNELYKDSN